MGSRKSEMTRTHQTLELSTFIVECCFADRSELEHGMLELQKHAEYRRNKRAATFGEESNH